MLILEPKFPHGLASIALSPCGKWLVALPQCSYSPKPRPKFGLKYWSLPQPSKRAKLLPTTNPQHIAFSTTGALFLEEVTELGSSLTCLDFPPDGTGRVQYPQEFGTFVSLSPDGRFAFAFLIEWKRNVRKLRLWDTQAESEATLKRSAFHRGTDHTCVPMVFALDGKLVSAITVTRVATRAAQRRSVAVWDFPSGKLRASLQLRAKADPRGLAFSPCGQKLAGLDLDVFYIWDSSTLEQVARRVPEPVYPLGRITNDLFCSTFTPDGRLFAVGCRDGTVRLFDTRNWKEAKNYDWGKQMGYGDDRGSRAAVRHVAFTPDGAMGIAAVGNNIVLWDME